MMKRVICAVLACLVLSCPVLAKDGEGNVNIEYGEFDEEGNWIPDDDREETDDDIPPDEEDPSLDDEPGSGDDAVEDPEEDLPPEDDSLGDPAEGIDPDMGVVPEGGDTAAVAAALDSGFDRLADGVYNLWTTLDQTQEFTARAVPDDAPSSGYYMSVSTDLGEGDLYVPFDFRTGCFSFDNSGLLMSLSNSTVNALLVIGSSVYDVRFQLFSRPEYRRPNGSNWTWTPLAVDDVTGGNVQVFRNASDVMPWISQDLSEALVLVLLGVIACKVFMSR